MYFAYLELYASKDNVIRNIKIDLKSQRKTAKNRIVRYGSRVSFKVFFNRGEKTLIEQMLFTAMKNSSTKSLDLNNNNNILFTLVPRRLMSLVIKIVM